MSSFEVEIRSRLWARKLARLARAWAGAFGLDPLALGKGAVGLPKIIRDYWKIRAQRSTCSQEWPLRFSTPCPHDYSEPSGIASGHYFHQDLLVAQRIYQSVPRKHVDVGSRVDGFVAHVAAFREIEVLDIRPCQNRVKNINFVQCDVMDLPRHFDDYCDSLSCLHALEHFGLGRYGDRVARDGHFRGFHNLVRLARQGGTLYLSVPLGQQRIEFNGHRVFDFRTVLQMAEGLLELTRFSYVEDSGVLHENVSLRDERVLSGLKQLYYGCGIFEFGKI